MPPASRRHLLGRLLHRVFPVLALFSLLASLAAPALRAQSDSFPIAITPTTLTALVSDRPSLSLADSTGLPASNARWSIDPPIAELIEEDGELTISPKEAGRATITATLGNHTATARLTILPGPAFPPASVRWTVLPTPGFQTLLVLQAMPTGDSDAAFFSVESSSSSNALLRAFNASGQQLWRVSLSSMASPTTLTNSLPTPGEVFLNNQTVSDHSLFIIGDKSAFAQNNATDPSNYHLPPDGKSILLRGSGDNLGGALLLERGRFRDSLVDINPRDGSELWRFPSEGRLGNDWTVNHNGDVALVETLTKPVSSALLILDGKTGALRFKIPFPTSSSTINGFRCTDPAHNVLTSIRPSQAGSIFTSTDSDMYVQLEVHTESVDLEACKNKQYSFDDSLLLFHITPDGRSDFKAFQHIHADGDGNFVVQPRVFAGESIPDGFGGVLAAWTYFDPHTKPKQPLQTEARLSVISPDGQRDYTLPMPYWTPGINSFFDSNMVLSEHNKNLYAVNGPQLIRFDHVQGEVNWVRHPPTGSVKIQHSTAGGGILVTNAGRLVYFDLNGNGVDFPWTVAVPGTEDIGLVQSDPFAGTPLAPLALRELHATWDGGTFIAVEDGAPHGSGSLILFSVH